MENHLKTDLSKYNNFLYKKGASQFKIITWYMLNALFFNSAFPIMFFKIFLLRLYGAKIGKNLIIKPFVNIKYPWNLIIGNNVWIGERVWIDNLAFITLNHNSCVSQGAILLCGNHNYTKTTFDLMVNPIIIEEGAWIGAKAIVCPGVTIGTHSVLTVNSVATKSLDQWGIYQGNPAVKIKIRKIQS